MEMLFFALFCDFSYSELEFKHIALDAVIS